ncbi:hypothetical protein [Hyphomonas sp.]|uniref:hypothetical protein n=1 Tax=Hyphomonas sp. TaxID=87 RepID=UPI0025B9005C|nr:hypothetical protein [Hyphomonas sp.]
MTQNSARIFNGFQQSKFMRIHSLSILPAVLLCFLVPGMSSAEAEAGSASLSNPLCEGIEGFGLERCLELADVAGMLLRQKRACEDRLDQASQVADLCVNNDYLIRSEKYADRLKDVKACIDKAQSMLEYDKYGADRKLDECRKLSTPYF